MYSILKEMALPPGSIWLVFAAGFVLLLLRKRRAAVAACGFGLALFYVLSTPIVAGRLIAAIQTIPAMTEAEIQSSPAQAIVVLSGGLYYNSPEFGGMTVDAASLERLRYAARLQRMTGLPLLVSGGRPAGANVTLAGAMKDTLERDFGIHEIITEDRSLNTYENALYSASILKERAISTILLVTHANHMPRAVPLFADQGLTVLPAPTVFAYTAAGAPANYIPRISGLADSHFAIYEIVGRLWYWLRY